MQLIGQSVTHEVFGAGVITSATPQTVTVRFSRDSRGFLFPEAFSGYLVAQDTALQTQITALLEQEKARRLAQEHAEMEAFEKEAALKNRKIPTRSQAAFDVSPAALETVFSDWHVDSGTYLSGASRGEPRIPDRLGSNSLCLITVRPAGAPENARVIAGLFMAPEDFTGSGCFDGQVPAHPDHRIRLSEENRIAFWPLVNPDPARQKWGSAALKYLPNETGEQILRTLRDRMPDNRQLQQFYEYFCHLNRLQAIPARQIL